MILYTYTYIHIYIYIYIHTHICAYERGGEGEHDCVSESVRRDYGDTGEEGRMLESNTEMQCICI
jgi:hypothetical protein